MMERCVNMHRHMDAQHDATLYFSEDKMIKLLRCASAAAAHFMQSDDKVFTSFEILVVNSLIHMDGTL